MEKKFINPTKMSAGIYESPECDFVELMSEGVLCASFETPVEDDSFEW